MRTETGKREMSTAAFAEAQPQFQHLWRTHDAVYGCTLGQGDVGGLGYAFLDYPGEYPRCKELDGLMWQGLLVLPPHRAALVQRLRWEGREARVEAALREHDEVLEELSLGEYRSPNWRVFYSHDEQSLERLVTEVAMMRLFVLEGDLS